MDKETIEVLKHSEFWDDPAPERAEYVLACIQAALHSVESREQPEQTPAWLARVEIGNAALVMDEKLRAMGMEIWEIPLVRDWLLVNWVAANTDPWECDGRCPNMVLDGLRHGICYWAVQEILGRRPSDWQMYRWQGWTLSGAEAAAAINKWLEEVPAEQ